MNVCDNLGDHLVGNVYVKFKKEDVSLFCVNYLVWFKYIVLLLQDALKACTDLNNRWFGGRPIYAELTPVTDFREACCRQYETGECTRSGFCTFMHLKPISRKLRGELYGRHGNKGGGRDDRERERQPDLKDEIDQERKRHRSRSRDRDRRRDRRGDRPQGGRDRGGRDGRY